MACVEETTFTCDGIQGEVCEAELFFGVGNAFGSEVVPYSTSGGFFEFPCKVELADIILFR